MAAATTTMMMEPRLVDIDINDCPRITFQTYLVSGGGNAHGELSSTELLVETASVWVLTGELPSPRSGLRGATIDNMVLMTGIPNNHCNNIENIRLIYLTNIFIFY